MYAYTLQECGVYNVTFQENNAGTNGGGFLAVRCSMINQHVLLSLGQSTAHSSPCVALRRMW